MSDTPQRPIADHPDAELLLFAAGEATPAQRAAVETHLGACAECRASLRELGETWQELEAQPMVEMTELEWRRALRGAMTPRVAQSIARHSWRSRMPAAAGLLAAALVVAALLSLSAASARQAREVARLHADLRETRALAVMAMLREPESAQRLRGVALGGPLLGDDARVAAAFVTVLRSDPSPNVRLAVLDAVDGAPRHAPLTAEILRALPDEPQPAVRMAMIELAAQLNDPRLRDALDAVSKGDPDPSVRARARTARDRLTRGPADARQ